MVIRVDHPYFDTMRFRLNKSTVEGAQTSGYGNTDPTRDPDYQEYWNMGQEIKEILTRPGRMPGPLPQRPLPPRLPSPAPGAAAPPSPMPTAAASIAAAP